jgi:hypothetical protein
MKTITKITDPVLVLLVPCSEEENGGGGEWGQVA